VEVRGVGHLRALLFAISGWVAAPLARSGKAYVGVDIGESGRNSPNDVRGRGWRWGRHYGWQKAGVLSRWRWWEIAPHFAVRGVQAG